MYIVEVNDKKSAGEFLKVPLLIYKNDPDWIRPLDKDIEDVFDPKTNKMFRHGEACRWVLKDDNGNLIGRVAAFYNKITANSFKYPTGGMGFFDCIDNENAAILLFNTCKQWLKDRGMKAMDGPVNFGEKDRFWGLLVEGFTEPTYCVNYNPPYYQKFFENYGFKVYFEQYTYSRSVSDPLEEKFRLKAAKIAENPKYTFKHLKKNNLEKYTEDFRIIYNQAWSNRGSFKGMRKEHAVSIMNKIKHIMDEKIIWYAYYEDEPVAFFIMLPEINQIIKHLNGQMDWLGKLKFLWYRWGGKCRKMYGVAFGVVPSHQKKGLEGAIVEAAAKVVQPMNKYDVLEMIWIGDFNPKMINVVKGVGGKRIKVHYTYRFIFDPAIPFERMPSVD